MNKRIEQCIIDVMVKSRRRLEPIVIDPDENYIVRYSINSLDFIMIIQSIEQEFKVKVSLNDLNMKNFNTLNKIKKYIEEKKNEEGI